MCGIPCQLLLGQPCEAHTMTATKSITTTSATEPCVMLKLSKTLSNPKLEYLRLWRHRTTSTNNGTNYTTLICLGDHVPIWSTSGLHSKSHQLFYNLIRLGDNKVLKMEHITKTLQQRNIALMRLTILGFGDHTRLRQRDKQGPRIYTWQVYLVRSSDKNLPANIFLSGC